MVKAALGHYVFVEEPGRLQILLSGGEYAARLIFGTVLAVGGFAGSIALLVALGPSLWSLGTGAVAVLGVWLLVRFLVKGRTIWTLDRTSGELLYREQLLRPLSSITHLAVFGVVIPGQNFMDNDKVMHYVAFAPKIVKTVLTTGLYGLRNDVLAFSKAQEASQASMILATFLGVSIVPESID